eukprot:scaffold11442_cov50-Phaeocystis_antarctica.AAC.1
MHLIILSPRARATGPTSPSSLHPSPPRSARWPPRCARVSRPAAFGTLSSYSMSDPTPASRAAAPPWPATIGARAVPRPPPAARACRRAGGRSPRAPRGSGR